MTKFHTDPKTFSRFDLQSNYFDNEILGFDGLRCTSNFRSFRERLRGRPTLAAINTFIIIDDDALTFFAPLVVCCIPDKKWSTTVRVNAAVLFEHLIPLELGLITAKGTQAIVSTKKFGAKRNDALYKAFPICTEEMIEEEKKRG